jgi:4-hydroxy-tetrahydrodipicolinate synthase
MNKNSLPKGTYTALITPFRDGKIDYTSLEKILQNQVEAGITGIVLCGTTGESSTLSCDEKFDIVKFGVKNFQNKIKIIAGTGGNNTLASAELTKRISGLEPSGFLVVSPYYNKATSEGLLLHFKYIASKTDLPIILYNVPTRTNVNISDDIIAKLASENKNIIGLKDATGDLSRVPSLRLKVSRDFLLFSGEDATALAFNASGGDGIISVVSNIAPALVRNLQEISLSRNNLESAFELQARVFQIASVLFNEVNPIPIKYAMYLKGLCKEEYRLPLCSPTTDTIAKIKQILDLC